MICWSSSPIRSSSSPVPRPSLARASRSACASARSVTVARCSWVAGSGSMTGSRSRCQPSRHCAARRIRARSAQDGHTDARVCPHGIRTCSTWPVSISVRRSCTGRRQAPCSAARSLTTCRASGMRHPLGPRRPPRGHQLTVREVGGVEGPGVAAQAAFGPQHRAAGVDQDQAGAADRAGFVGAPGSLPHRPPPGREPTASAIAMMSASVT